MCYLQIIIIIIIIIITETTVDPTCLFSKLCPLILLYILHFLLKSKYINA